MSDVIDFLERIGCDADMRLASDDKFAAAAVSARLDPEVQSAILARDQEKLRALVGLDNVCCALMPGKEEREDEGEDEDEDDQSPRRDSESSFQASVGRSGSRAG